ncbi:hypothetical protein [Alsobacter sp. R-9]
MKALSAGIAVALLAALAGPAAAQYYDPYARPYYRPPPPPPPYYGGGGGYYGYPPRESYYYRPRPALRSVCVTSRGSCSTGYPMPSGAPCRCFIPGFGEKRGAVP